MSSVAARHPGPPFAWPAFLAAMPPSQRNFTLAMAASLMFHAILLSIHFRLPEALLRNAENALDVVLVNSKHAHKPKNAQVHAQTNLDGGGDSENNERAATPLPPSAATHEGNDVIEARQRVARLEAQQRQLMTQLKAKALSNAAPKHNDAPVRQQEQPAESGLDLASRAMAIARLEAQIDRQTNEYNKRPRKKNIGIRAEEYRFAQYVEDWRQKIERIGNLNYPEAARGRWYGSLVLTVTILNDGQLKDVEVNRSSGVPLLDDAARRIVRMAAPYAAFPDNIKRDTDIIEITRKWAFTREDMVQTQAANR
ncbi:TonB protein [Georgfuchsia toluolica]|uniref:TonB protein n=1 Tax=Georgfuchsia toluolica TaxID=424218 RepID=A0A916N0Y7_9PROT|nr:energy transducer TonB [Georgfuchsia toluolica]CAG4884393.1 TonB protein [Georgfuchsia toluolica]